MALVRTLPLTLTETDSAALLSALPPGPGQFLLESGESGPSEIRRRSFLGAEPFQTLTTRGRTAQLQAEGAIRVLEGDPFAILQGELDRCRLTAPPDFPGMPGGAVGYFAYDLGRQVERLESLAVDELGLPDLYLNFYDVILALDHETGAASLLIGAPDGREDEALAKAERWARALEGATPLETPLAADGLAPGPVTSSFDRKAYLRAVDRALGYIGAGDIFQVNLAQRFRCPWEGTGFQLYQRLRQLSPAPFSAYLEGGPWQVVSGSPERFLTVEGDRIETRPIKGTRPRSADPRQDQANAEELLASEKDRAELVMIVDLQRNDLGRICEYGSVKVSDLRRLEGFPNVWHTVATVEGQVRQGLRADAILRATFPGGSITGAPKVRAMEIIEELEPVRRSVYTGAIGYIGFDGRIDLNIAIRTAVVQDGYASFHAGGGIVADSNPAAEYQETLAKGRGIATALGVSLDDLP